MKKTKRILALLLALFISASLLVGCDGDDGKENPSGESKSTDGETSVNLPTVSNDLKMKVEGEVDKTKTLTTLIDCDASPAFNGNPFDETAGVNWSIQPFMFDYLAFFAPMPDRVFKNSLMESYTYEDKVLTIKLLSGQKWSDGSVLDAEDVLTNFYCDLNTSAVWSYLEKIEKVDDLTLKLTYSQDSPLLLNISFRNPIRTPNEIFGKWAERYKEIAENDRVYDEATQLWKLTEDGNKKAAAVKEELIAYKPKPDEVVCSGPYVIDKYNTSEILFKVNKQFRKEPLISSIRGLRPGDSQAFATAILAGEYTIENGGLNVDMSKQIDNKYADTLRKVYVPELSQIGYTINTQVYPLDKVEVRKAIAMALDRKSLLAVSEPGSFPGTNADSGLIPALQPTYADDTFVATLDSHSYNPEESAKLLESIGWSKKDGKWVDDKGDSPKITIGTINSWPTFMMTGEAMSQMLTDFGFNIEFKPMEFGVWNDFTKSDEKMLVCTFIASAPSYAHPWECFKDLFSNPRTGWQKFEASEDKIFKDPVTGKEYNVTKMLSEMYITSDQARLKELTQELMTLSNHLCGYISILEKAAPLRIYDPKLSMPDTEMNIVQHNFLYFGNINDMIAKMLLDDQIYFVK